jgi:hypothetical protein
VCGQVSIESGLIAKNEEQMYKENSVSEPSVRILEILFYCMLSMYQGKSENRGSLFYCHQITSPSGMHLYSLVVIVVVGIIIIIIIITISFMQGIHTHIPDTNPVPNNTMSQPFCRYCLWCPYH